MTGTSEQYVLGVDFGTLSGRAVVVRVRDGAQLGDATHSYRHGVVDRVLPGSGKRLGSEWALQIPNDYVEVLQHAVPAAVAAAGIEPGDVIGIATDFTACTVLPTLADGTPLCQLPAFRDRPHAYAKLWRHHAAQPQADRINALARTRHEPWLQRYGGAISSEWEFAKALQILEEDREIYDRMDRWVEAADWIVWQLCGNYVRNACATGYKAIYQDGSYPTPDFLTALNADFGQFVDAKVRQPMGQLGGLAGSLTAEAAQWTGLPTGIAVAVGNVDAHVTAPAAQATLPGQMLAIMGTSTCHVLSSDHVAEVPGMCGVVEGGIIPGLWGYEAGQSGVGDIFAWFVDHYTDDDLRQNAESLGLTVHQYLSNLGAEQAVGGHGLVALDWLSGNRSVLVDHSLTGVIVGLSLATRPEDVYRALLESTAFGTRTIVEAFQGAGVPVTEFIAAGGLTRNPVLMQLYSDVLRMPISTVTSSQGPALGSAIHAAVSAAAYPDIVSASQAMGSRTVNAYTPQPTRADAYDRLYAEYVTLHDYFGRGTNDVLRRLTALRTTTHVGSDDTEQRALEDITA